MRSEYSKRWASKTRPYPGIGELLDALIAQQVKIAVFSNKPHEFTELCVTNLLGKWRFDAVRGLSSITPRKPDPSAALAIAQELGVDPSAFVYLGDTNTDMLTATRAGMFAVGVLWGFRGANELLSSGARALLHYPLELLSLSLVPSTVFERR
jgi:phosphoglycolate phosphatase